MVAGLFLLPIVAFGEASAESRAASAKADPKAPSLKIQDNSFLIEEAYNQEAGVIQHIQSLQYLRRDRSWSYTFTEEWPVPDQKHQLSATISIMRSSLANYGLKPGDVALNYRYQLTDKEQIALAPRFSLLFPTGNYKIGMGSGSLGVQTNVPISVELTDAFVTHWNLGATYTPASKSPGGTSRQTLGLNFGASVIWLTSLTFNVMLELAGATNEGVTDGGEIERKDSFYVNPGARFAINCKSGLQIVPGFAVPIGIGPSAGDLGAYAYLSFEHPAF